MCAAAGRRGVLWGTVGRGTGGVILDGHTTVGVRDALSLLMLMYHGRKCDIPSAYISIISDSSWEILDRPVAMGDFNFSVMFIYNVFFTRFRIGFIT